MDKTCYKCGSTNVETIDVNKVNHKGEHIRCKDCKAERFYPEQR